MATNLLPHCSHQSDKQRKEMPDSFSKNETTKWMKMAAYRIGNSLRTFLEKEQIKRKTGKEEKNNGNNKTIEE